VDTSRRVTVVHDGRTLGGVPADCYAILNMDGTGETVLDFAKARWVNCGLVGNASFSVANPEAGRWMLVRVYAITLERALTFQAGWRWVGGGPPSLLGAEKMAYLRLTCWGNEVGDVFAEWSETEGTV
jgi:hypothetical protein